ncbi:hypothetical protein ABZV91_14845 [Nocardia sp. NPDC004568]|uniref:hypothetical protein n=1 Tax=Nocardia sp. NPDC004568 TaxID=3154551 RepID=UPI0033BE1F08
MIRADLFDMLAAALQRYGPRRGTPFGGVQLVLVGDLFKLPPVVLDREAEFCTSRYESPYFFSADCYTPERFPTIEPTRVFHQVGDARLLEILAAIRAGTIDPQLLAELNARTEADFRPPVHEFWLALTTTNKSADRRNRDQLLQLEPPEISAHATETGQLDGFDRPTERQLVYKVGAQIMLLTNDGMGRWANGTIGRIVASRVEAGRSSRPAPSATRLSAPSPSCRSGRRGPSRSTRGRARRWTVSSSTSPVGLSPTDNCMSRSVAARRWQAWSYGVPSRPRT